MLAPGTRAKLLASPRSDKGTGAIEAFGANDQHDLTGCKEIAPLPELTINRGQGRLGEATPAVIPARDDGESEE